MIQPLASPADPARDLPDAATPLLAGWRGYYEHVYIALHPFVTAPPDDPQGFSWTLHLAAARRYRWAEVAAHLGDLRFAAFTRLLGAAIRPDADPEPSGAAAVLLDCAANLGLSLPWTGTPAPSLYPTLTALFSAAGADTAFLWDEGRNRAAALSLPEMLAFSPVTRLDWDAAVLRAGNGEALAVSAPGWAWTAIAMTGTARRLGRIEAMLEGFWAGPATTADWPDAPGTYDPPEGWLP